MSIGCRSGGDRYRPTYGPSVDRVSVGRVSASVDRVSVGRVFAECR